MAGVQRCLDVKNGAFQDGTITWLYQCHDSTHAAYRNDDYKAQFFKAELVEDKWFKITVQGFCLDIKDDSKEDGATVQLWTCSAGAQNQQWDFIAGSGGAYQIKSRSSGKCLDVDGGVNEQERRIHVWSCNGGANQLWKPQDPQVGSWTGAKELATMTSGANRCLDVQWSNFADGTILHLWECITTAVAGFASQAFTAERIEENWFKISSQGYCIDIKDGANNDGATVHIWRCNTALQSQHWRLMVDSRGGYQIYSRSANKCLDMDGGVNEQGRKIFIWTCNGGDNQRWKPQDPPSPSGRRRLQQGTGVLPPEVVAMAAPMRAAVAEVANVSLSQVQLSARLASGKRSLQASGTATMDVSVTGLATPQQAAQVSGALITGSAPSAALLGALQTRGVATGGSGVQVASAPVVVPVTTTSAPPPAPPPSPPEEPKSNIMVIAIAAGVGGGVVLLVIILVVVMVTKKRSAQQVASSSSYSPPSKATTTAYSSQPSAPAPVKTAPPAPATQARVVGSSSSGPGTPITAAKVSPTVPDSPPAKISSTVLLPTPYDPATSTRTPSSLPVPSAQQRSSASANNVMLPMPMDDVESDNSPPHSYAAASNSTLPQPAAAGGDTSTTYKQPQQPSQPVTVLPTVVDDDD